MARNPSSAYGHDIRCLYGADEFMSEVSGVELVKQDAFHLITCTDFLGKDGDGRGFDLKALLGKTGGELAAYGPIVSQVLIDDPRIITADVQFTETKTNGLQDVAVRIHCETAEGPFDIIDTVRGMLTKLTQQGTI